ncbi:hypothetical protein HZH68_004282 [Vespula germanica]|uniref:Uncharacterized protein n=1 Tax=Vespula germanica TaxID=30212 RepID=A0A834KQ95_VESGE|nr:hypothetical protein HZH68_004282 [Vespula germanica]
MAQNRITGGKGADQMVAVKCGNAGNVANNVPPSPPAASRIQNTEGQVQQDGAAALHRVLCAESIVEKERRLSEMILQLQLLREQLLQQQDQKKRSLRALAHLYSQPKTLTLRMFYLRQDSHVGSSKTIYDKFLKDNFR